MHYSINAFLGTLVACSTLWIGACAPTNQYVCSFTSDDPASRIQQWSLGCHRTRQPDLRSSGMAIIWYSVESNDGTPRLGKELGRQCVTGHSLLPDSKQGHVYVVSASLLYRATLRDGEVVRKPVKLQTPLGGWSFSQLLAIRKSSSPLQMLAAMVKKNKDGSLAKSIWIFEVDGDTAVGKPWVKSKTYEAKDARAYGRDFVSPRCVKGFSECLVMPMSSKQKGLGHVAKRGKPMTKLGGSDKLQIIDAAWASSTKKASVVLQANACKP